MKIYSSAVLGLVSATALLSGSGSAFVPPSLRVATTTNTHHQTSAFGFAKHPLFMSSATEEKSETYE